MSFPLVEQLHKKAVTVERLCCVLRVSRSGDRRWRRRAPGSAQGLRGQRLTAKAPGCLFIGLRQPSPHGRLA